jgi:hypothetical protein
MGLSIKSLSTREQSAMFFVYNSPMHHNNVRLHEEKCEHAGKYRFCNHKYTKIVTV